MQICSYCGERITSVKVAVGVNMDGSQVYLHVSKPDNSKLIFQDEQVVIHNTPCYLYYKTEHQLKEIEIKRME